jgi:hypothetical protein
MKIILSKAPKAFILIRVVVGGIFLSEGIQKVLFPDAQGMGRFIKIGIPAPEFFTSFVGVGSSSRRQRSGGIGVESSQSGESFKTPYGSIFHFISAEFFGSTGKKSH